MGFFADPSTLNTHKGTTGPQSDQESIAKMEEEDHLTEEHDSADEEEVIKKTKKKRDGSAFRKAPQAPKRFKSSYICFFMAKQPEIKKELGHEATVTEISKRSAEMWRNLPAEDRAHWDDVAAKDKQRYMMEKASYTGPWQVPWKRQRKDPSAPKRPMSAFLYFSQERRRDIKKQHPEMRNTDISRMLGDMWRKAPLEERQPHIDREKKEREKYKIKIAEWRKEDLAKKEALKKAHEEQAALMTSAYRAPDQADEQSQQFPAGSMAPPGSQPSYLGYPPPPSHMYGMPPSSSAYSQGYGEMYASYPPNAYYQQGPKQMVVLGPNGMPQYQVPYPQMGAPLYEENEGGSSGGSPYDYSQRVQETALGGI